MRLVSISAVVFLLSAGCISESGSENGEQSQPPVGPTLNNTTNATNNPFQLPENPFHHTPFKLEYYVSNTGNNPWNQTVKLISKSVVPTVTADGWIVDAIELNLEYYDGETLQKTKRIFVDENYRIVSLIDNCIPNNTQCDFYAHLFLPGNPAPMGFGGRKFIVQNELVIHQGPATTTSPFTFEMGWLNISSEFDRMVKNADFGLQSGQFHYPGNSAIPDQIQIPGWHAKLIHAEFGNITLRAPPHEYDFPITGSSHELFDYADEPIPEFPETIEEIWNYVKLATPNMPSKYCVGEIAISAFDPDAVTTTWEYSFKLQAENELKSLRLAVRVHVPTYGPNVWEIGPQESSTAMQCPTTDVPRSANLPAIWHLQKGMPKAEESNNFYFQYQSKEILSMNELYGNMYHTLLVKPADDSSGFYNFMFNAHNGWLYLIEGPASLASELDTYLLNLWARQT